MVLTDRRRFILGFLIIEFFLFLSIHIFPYSKFLNLKNLIFSFFIWVIWFLINYIVGRYKDFLNISKFKIILKTNISLFIFLSLILFLNKIFLINIVATKNYFSEIIIFAITSQIIFSIYSIFIRKYFNKDEIWGVISDSDLFKNLQKELDKIPIRRNPKLLKIELNKLHYSTINNLNGLIIDSNNFDQKYMPKIKKFNKQGVKTYGLISWSEKYMERIPSCFLYDSFLDNKFSYSETFDGYDFRIKRIGDIFVSLLIFIFSIPLMLIIYLLIKLEDGGPFLYSQLRCGLNGKNYKLWKIRTMIKNAEKDGPKWSTKFDRRITKIGKILRTTRIDEIPQIYSVFTGEMSLIGPRPERPEIDNLLKSKIKNYEKRYKVKPGISGWAQVNYPYGASVIDSGNKLSYDLYYINNFSLFLDLLIFFKTLKLVLNLKGSTPVEQ